MKELIYHRYLVPAAERMGSQPASIDGEFVATYEQHLGRVNRLAGCGRP